jgi:hypothetical protein
MPAIPARGLLRMKYGGTTMAVERGRVEPSQAELDLRKAENSLVSTSQHLLDRQKIATPPSDGVARVGSLRPRQETWFRAGTQDWALSSIHHHTVYTPSEAILLVLVLRVLAHPWPKA